MRRVVFLSAVLLTFPIITPYRVGVTLKQGTLIGTSRETVFDKKLYYAFFAVPYSRAPIGNFRFKDPKSVKRSNNTEEDATIDYYGTCAQAHIVHKERLFGGEDCLRLNIHTPLDNREGEKKPVVVFFHGYAYTSSFSHIYGPDFLIENDVVYISVSYRLGVLGFYKDNAMDPHGNMGLKDIVRSLKWIRTNVEHFGGDRRKVTVMGSGSAATYLALLLTTVHRKLFSKMILHSAAIYSPSLFKRDILGESETFKQELFKKYKKDPMTASIENIVSASQKIYTNKNIINAQRPIVPFTPMQETASNTSLLNKDTFAFTKDDVDIPIMIGYNTQESISEMIPFLHNPKLLKGFQSYFKFMVPYHDGCSLDYTSEEYARVAERIKSFYFRSGITEQSVHDFLKYTGDLHKYPILKFIKTLQSYKKNLFMYKFNYQGRFNVIKANSLGDLNITISGAATGDELCYILKCQPVYENYGKLESRDNDTVFIKEISTMWANFAKTGDPTPVTYTGDVKWPPMDKDNDNVLYISNRRRLTDTRVDEAMYRFWENLYADFYSPQKCKGVKDEL